MREEVFMLMYNMKGLTYRDIEEMPSADREWYLERMLKQKRKEWKAYNKK